jgi:hypothetical protein
MLTSASINDCPSFAPLLRIFAPPSSGDAGYAGPMATNPTDPFDGFEITDEWAEGARKREKSAQERADRYAKINHGNKREEAARNEQIKQKPTRSKKVRSTKVWPWLAFAGLCAVVIGLSFVL